MKLKFLTLSSIVFLICSCSNDKEISKDENLLKKFTVKSGNSYMLHESYPNESLNWDYLATTLNLVDGKVIHSDILLNFETENFLNKVEIDSVFLILKPYPDQNFGENSVEINLLKNKFLKTYTWNTKPLVNKDVYVKTVKIDKDDTYKIDITNLVQFQKNNYGYDLPLSLSLYDENLKESTFAGFFSLTNDLKSSAPKLEVYYKK